MLDKKQIWVIFLLKFKIGRKAVETTRNINDTFGPATANKCSVQWWFKEFYKRDERLEDEECNGWPSKIGNDQLRAIFKANSLKISQKIYQCTQLQPFYGHSAFEVNWKGENTW